MVIVLFLGKFYMKLFYKYTLTKNCAVFGWSRLWVVPLKLFDFGVKLVVTGSPPRVIVEPLCVKNLDSDCDRTKMSYSPLSETAECVQRRAISKMTNWITKIDLKRNPFTCEDGVVLDSL